MTEATLAVEAIRDVGPGGHFFGAAHTMERYETAFYTPLLSNWDNHPQWLERGAVQARERANTVWKQMLRRLRAAADRPGHRRGPARLSWRGARPRAARR